MECYQIPCNIIGNLKISCDITNSTVVLWSKYQLFVYENLNFRNYSKKIEPQFEIEEVIVLQHCLVCLDCSGNVNIDTFESFLIWKQNIKCICVCENMNIQYLVSLQFEQNRAVLWVNDFYMADSPNENDGMKLIMPNEDWMTPGESNIMVCGYINKEYLKRVSNIFNIGESDLNYFLIILCLDKRNVYAVLFPKENVNMRPQADLWVKLYNSHTDIIDIKISMKNDIYILVGLSGGNIIKIPLLLKNQKPEVYHLNTTINKFTIIDDDTLIYTDVLTMWKNENVFSKSEFSCEQFVVKNVRDFCVIKNQIVCITFSNLIYSFDISHRYSYVIPPDKDYSCEVQLVTNSDYLQEIMEMVKKNEELLKKINKESEYLMALSLSERQDVMDDLIQATAIIYDNYRDLVAKNTNLTLTDELDAYYNSESYYFLINILIMKIKHKLNKLLSDMLGDIKIHITLFAHEVLKTTSIQIEGQLTTKNFVIALKKKNINITRLQVHVKIITNVPGKFDENQRQWIILYQKCIHLNAENFITMKTNTNITLLKEDDIPLDMMILKRANRLYSTEYKFQISDYKKYEWTLFVKLPKNSNLHMEQILGLIDLNSKKVNVYWKHLVKVSKGKNFIEFQIGKEQVRLSLEGTNLIVTSTDIMIASDIRNLFSSMIFTTFKDELGKELIDHKYYTTIENLKRDIKDYMSYRISTEEFAIFLTRFLRNVYCLIPI